MMFKLQSCETIEITGRGTCFFVESPVSAARNFKALRAAIGDVVVIDGKEYEPIGFEMNMPMTPVHIGERIGILVRSKDTCFKPII